MRTPEHVVLENDAVRMEPLSLEHADGLYEAGGFPAVWHFLHRTTHIRTRDDAVRYIREIPKIDPSALPYAVMERKSGRIVGSSSYLDVSVRFSRLELGLTWFDPLVWGSGANANVKLLMLENAFERWDVQKVMFRVDRENVRSAKALERIGAVYEGCLRNHSLRPADNTRRDVMLYGVLRGEWPEVRERILARTHRK